MQSLLGFSNVLHLICVVVSASVILLAGPRLDEERSVWCRKRVVTFWEVKSTDTVAELNHTHWLSFTSQPQAFQILHTEADLVMKGKQERIISLHALVAFCFTEMWHLGLVIPLTAASALWELAVSIFRLFRAWLLILRAGRRHISFGSRLVWIGILAAAPWVIKN